MSDGSPANDPLADADYETLDVSVGEHADRVATITISRPEARNALNAAVRRDLKDAVPRAESDEEVRVVVLTGDDEGGAFAAGADITELQGRDSDDQREASERPRIYETVADASLPIVARVNGHALGGGCELIQACDVRIASAEALVGQPEISLGIMPGGGGTQRLPRLVGTGHAMRLVLSGELIDATEAAEIGLVEEVHEEETLDERVYELAGSMAEKSPLALAAAKESIRASARLGMDEGLAFETEQFVSLFDTSDKEEGIAAFVEDREPEFEGR